MRFFSSLGLPWIGEIVDGFLGLDVFLESRFVEVLSIDSVDYKDSLKMETPGTSKNCQIQSQKNPSEMEAPGTPKTLKIRI